MCGVCDTAHLSHFEIPAPLPAGFRACRVPRCVEFLEGPVPTKRPRLNLTIEPETYAALHRLAEASGVAATSWANNLLNDSVPLLDAMAEAFRVVKTNPQRSAHIMAELANKATLQSAQASLELREEKPKLRKRGTGVGQKKKGER